MNKLTPTEISSQMTDKSTAIPVGICEDVHVMVANVTILTDFVILDIPEDDSMSIILGKPFLNTVGVVIDCNRCNVTFHINGNEHTVHFSKKQFQVNGINVIEKSLTITIGSFQLPYLLPKRNMKCLLLGTSTSPLR